MYPEISISSPTTTNLGTIFQLDEDQLKKYKMSPPQNENNDNTQADVASIRSTSTLSSLKALLPKKSDRKPKSPRPGETPQDKALRREATYAYFSTK